MGVLSDLNYMYKTGARAQVNRFLREEYRHTADFTGCSDNFEERFQQAVRRKSVWKMREHECEIAYAARRD